MERSAVILKKARLDSWVDEIRKKYTVCGPVKFKKDHRFQELEPGQKVELEYTRTVIPPKKYLHPQRENLVTYRRNSDNQWELPVMEKKTVVLGVHSCDARAMITYDTVFGGDQPDPYYWNRRKNTIIVAISCTIPDEDCFCVSMDKNGPTLEKGFDLLMTDLGDRYHIEIGSTEGSLLIQIPGMFEKAGEEELKARDRAVSVVRTKIADRLPKAYELPEFLEKNFESEIWTEQAKKCVSCGSCTLTCPTCFCYHVEDFNRFSLNDGNRVRIWDSCQLIDFAEVAMGENFRKDRTARLKWRIYHKLAYWGDQFNKTAGCVGCGRCMHYCMASIDMTTAIAEIRGETANA